MRFSTGGRGGGRSDVDATSVIMHIDVGIVTITLVACGNDSFRLQVSVNFTN